MIKLLSVKVGLALFLATVITSDIAHAQNNNNEYKFFIPRSATLFSPRFSGSAVDKIDTAQDFHSSSIVWHYPYVGPTFDSSLITEAQSRLDNETINAALPSFTRNSAHACKDSSGNAISHHSNSSIYYPDTQNSGFRAEVTTFLMQASAAGVTSFQQDDPAFMAVRRSTGCYSNFSPLTIEGYVDDYYDWLLGQIDMIFGHSVPLTFNMSLESSNSSSNTYKRLAPYFNAVMGEARQSDNTPENLINAIHFENNVGLNLTTITTLVDTSPLRNKRHIASAYALGAHPIVPYDVYIGPNQPRYFGTPTHYASYYQFVNDNPTLFDGFGILSLYADHYQNSAGLINTPGGLTGVASRHNVMAVLKGNAAGKRILHVVNWQVQRQNMTDGQHYFTFWIDKSSIPFIPTTAKIHRPRRTPYTTTVFDNGDGRWKVTVGGVDVWGLAEFQ